MLTGQRSKGALLGVVLAVLAAGCLLAASPAVAQDPGEGAVNISVEPTETAYGPGDNVTFEVIVEGAGEDVVAYDYLDIVIEDPGVAQFVDFSEAGEDSNATFVSDTQIQNQSGNQTSEGSVLSMSAALFAPPALKGDEIVIAEAEVEVLGEFTSATDVSIVENPDVEQYNEPQIAMNTGGDAYNVSAMEDTEVVLRDEANVSLVPTETGLLPGDTTTYEVVVEDAEYGIQGYDGLAVTIENPDSGQFVGFTETAEDNVDPGGDPPDSNSEIRDAEGTPAETGSVVWLDADLADGSFEAAEEIVLAELEVEVTGIETTAVTADTDRAVQDLQTVDYDIIDTTAAELDPIGIDVTGNGKPATDTTGNGLLNDVDGDGQFDIFDVQALFTHVGDQQVQDNPQLFDFSGDGAVSIADVQALFEGL